MTKPKDKIFEEFKEPFLPEEVKWRAGATSERDGKLVALALPFIDARAVMDRLDDVVGPENWEDSYIETTSGFLVTLRVRIEDEWISKSDGADRTNYEPAKGGISDSFKRVGVKFGIGRYLYNVGSTWVLAKKTGKNGKNVKLLETPKLPIKALPAGYRPPQPVSKATNTTKPSRDKVSSKGNGKAPEKVASAGPTSKGDYKKLYELSRADGFEDRDVQKVLAEVDNDAVEAYALLKGMI